MSVGKWGPRFKLMLLCVKVVTTKRIYYYRKKEEKKKKKKTAFRIQAVSHLQKSKFRNWIYFTLVPCAIIADLVFLFPDLSRRPQNSFPDVSSDPGG